MGATVDAACVAPVAGGAADPPLTRDVHPCPLPTRHGSDADRGYCHSGYNKPDVAVATQCVHYADECCLDNNSKLPRQTYTNHVGIHERCRDAGAITSPCIRAPPANKLLISVAQRCLSTQPEIDISHMYYWPGGTVSLAIWKIDGWTQRKHDRTPRVLSKV